MSAAWTNAWHARSLEKRSLETGAEQLQRAERAAGYAMAFAFLDNEPTTARTKLVDRAVIEPHHAGYMDRLANAFEAYVERVSSYLRPAV